MIPLLSKLYGIKNMYIPTKVRYKRRFVVLINDYKGMWRKRAHTLSHLTKLCSTKVEFIWADVEYEFVMDMKKDIRTRLVTLII